MKNTPNHRGDPMKNSKKFLFQKSKCTHVSSINLKGKVSHSKNIVTAVVYFWEFPCGSPCMRRRNMNLVLSSYNLYVCILDFSKNLALLVPIFYHAWLWVWTLNEHNLEQWNLNWFSSYPAWLHWFSATSPSFRTASTKIYQLCAQ